MFARAISLGIDVERVLPCLCRRALLEEEDVVVLETRDQGVRCRELGGHRGQGELVVWRMRYLCPDPLEEGLVKCRFLKQNLQDGRYVEVEQI